MAAGGPSPADDASHDDFVSQVGITVEEVTPERIVGRLRVEQRHLQPMGLVHGGVYATMAETLASLGAWTNARERDPTAVTVGLENHTTFLRAARVGVEVVAEATVRHGGRRTQSWSVVMRDATSGAELAVSNVRLLVAASGTV